MKVGCPMLSVFFRKIVTDITTVSNLGNKFHFKTKLSPFNETEEGHGFLLTLLLALLHGLSLLIPDLFEISGNNRVSLIVAN